MALTEIPVLPSTHPLFEWTDYQSSRDALVSGSPTMLFAKEAWNAIVDSTNKALTAAGLSWDCRYTTAEEAKINGSSKQLTAMKFNSVRHNIDWPASLGWQWSINPNFHGYVGRDDFYGRSTHGKSADVVYASYILELSRKLDVLIEILRGTAGLSEITIEQLSDLLPIATLHAGDSRNLIVDDDVGVIYPDIRIEHTCGAPLETNCTASSRFATNVESLQSKPLEATVDNNTHTSVNAEKRFAQKLDVNEVVVTDSASASGDALIALKMCPVGVTAHESISSTVIAIPAGKIVDLVVQAAVAMISAQSTLKTSKAVGLSTNPHGGNSSIYASLQPSSPKYLQADHISHATADATFDSSQNQVDMGATCLCTTCTTSILSNDGWQLPVWVDGGLWIRQAHTINQREDGSLEVF